MSSILKYGATTLLSNTVTTSAVFAGTTRVTYENNSVSDSSNIFNQPIRLSIPQGTILNYQQPYTLYHYMPSSIQKNQLQNALHSNVITPYFGSTGSIFVSVQNSV
jgi:hypothetical protein